MTDELRRRRTDRSLGDRVTTVEFRTEFLEKRFNDHLLSSERLHMDNVALMRKLDERDDRLEGELQRQSMRQAYAAGAVGVIIGVLLFLGTILGPAIQRSLGLPQ